MNNAAIAIVNIAAVAVIIVDAVAVVIAVAALNVKVANHYCFEAPEPAEGWAKINSIYNQFQP